jgi:hypothetical protein
LRKDWFTIKFKIKGLEYRLLVFFFVRARESQFSFLLSFLSRVIQCGLWILSYSMELCWLYPSWVSDTCLPHRTRVIWWVPPRLRCPSSIPLKNKMIRWSKHLSLWWDPVQVPHDGCYGLWLCHVFYSACFLGCDWCQR